MRIEIAIRTEKGSKSTEEEVKQTADSLLKIAHAIKSSIHGNIVDGKGFSDGAMVVIEKE